MGSNQVPTHQGTCIAIAPNKHKKSKEKGKEHKDPIEIFVKLNFTCNDTIVISSKQKNKGKCTHGDLVGVLKGPKSQSSIEFTNNKGNKARD